MLRSLADPQTALEGAGVALAVVVFLYVLAKVESGTSRHIGGRMLVWTLVLTPVLPTTVDILRGAGASLQTLTVDDSQLSSTAQNLSHVMQILLIASTILALRESSAAGARGTTTLFWLVTGLWFATLLSAIDSSWSPKLAGWLLPVVVYALFASSRAGMPVLAELRRVVFVLLGASLLMYALRPGLALESGTRGGSTALRLAGVFSQPNGLGDIAAAGLVLALATTRGVRLAVLAAVACACMVLSDSRSAFAAAAVAVPLVLAAPSMHGSRGRTAIRRLALVVGSVIAGVLIVQNTVLDTADLTALNGRTLIWEYVRQEWQQHPWFGAGPNGWLSARLLSEVPVYAGQAHNQFFDTLYLYGVVGLLALAALLVTCLVRAWGRWRLGAPAALALLVCLLVTGVAESPFKLDVSGFSQEGAIALCAIAAIQSGIGRGPGSRGSAADDAAAPHISDAEPDDAELDHAVLG
jgi:O-antigen ligase